MSVRCLSIDTFILDNNALNFYKAKISLLLCFKVSTIVTITLNNNIVLNKQCWILMTFRLSFLFMFEDKGMSYFYLYFQNMCFNDWIIDFLLYSLFDLWHSAKVILNLLFVMDVVLMCYYNPYAMLINNNIR